MSLYDIRLLYRREVRMALRERGVVLGCVILPLFFYPVLLWLMLSSFGFVQGQDEKRPGRVALVDLPADHGELQRLLDGQLGLEVVTFDVIALGDTESALRGGTVDLVATFSAIEPEAEHAATRTNFAVSLAFNGSHDRSLRAKQRFEDQLSQYRRQWLDEEASRQGIDETAWVGWRVELENIASGEDVGAFLLGMLAPMLIAVMITIGCLYPAIDATAGERERSTWETTMTLGVSHGSVLVAKYLYVATLGAVAGLVNLAAMTVSTGALLQPLLAGADISFGIPWTAWPLIVVACFVFALSVAAGMMLFTAFARTFKEGQAMLGPIYILNMLPPILVTSPDLTLTSRWALVPVANICLLFRQAINGQVDGPLALLTLAVQALVIMLLLLAARWVLRFEDVALGSYGGSLTQLISERWRRREGSARA